MQWQEGPPLLRTGGSSQASARHQREKPQLAAVPTPQQAALLAAPVWSEDLPHPMDPPRQRELKGFFGPPTLGLTTPQTSGGDIEACLPRRASTQSSTGSRAAREGQIALSYGCGPQASSPAGWLGSYRKEPLHSPVLPVGVSLRQGAAVNRVAVKGIVKTCSERTEMGSRFSPISDRFLLPTKPLGFYYPLLAGALGASLHFPLQEGGGKHFHNRETEAAAIEIPRAP